MKNFIKTFLSVSVLIVLIILLPLVLIFRVISEFWSLIAAKCVNDAGTFGDRIWSFLERLLAVYIIGFTFSLTLVSCSPPIDTHLFSDTIVVKTDSCHFSLDSANFVIDERKIEYVK